MSAIPPACAGRKRGKPIRPGLPVPLAGVVLLAIAVMFAGPPARAHVASLGDSTISAATDGIAVRLRLHARDLDNALGTALLPEGADRIAPDALSAARDRIADYVLDRARIHMADGPACEGRVADPVAEGVLVVLRLRWRCPPDAAGYDYEVTLFHEADTGARHIVRSDLPGATQASFIMDSELTRVPLSRPPNLLAVAGRYTLFGIGHLLIGPDHIAFLVAIVLWARRFWPLVRVVTAFTLAHSLTLSLAVLDLVALPAALTEPLIALTVIWVAAENFISRDTGRRWRMTLLLGLVHGFGFATVLREAGLERGALGVSLAAFNVGVEIGQIAIVAVVVGLLLGLDWLLARGEAEPVRPVLLVRLLSGAILLLGVYWLAERLLAL